MAFRVLTLSTSCDGVASSAQLTVPANCVPLCGGAVLHGSATLLGCYPSLDGRTWTVQLNSGTAGVVAQRVQLSVLCVDDSSGALDFCVIEKSASELDPTITELGNHFRLVGAGCLTASGLLSSGPTRNGGWAGSAVAGGSCMCRGIYLRRMDSASVSCSLNPDGCYGIDLGEGIGDHFFRFGASPGSRNEATAIEAQLESTDVDCGSPRRAPPSTWRRHRTLIPADRLVALKHEYCPARPKSSTF